MSRMRFIGTSLDKGYRDDLNYNFGLLEALIGESNGLTEALRQEMIDQIYNLQQQIDMLTGENIGDLLARLNDAIQQALTAAQEARTAKTATEEATALAIAAKELAIASATLADEKATYAEGKAILAQEAADNANQEAANLGQMKVDVVKATQDANAATGNANQATQEARTATNAINAVLPNVTGLENLQEWSSTIAYKKNNFVTFEGNGYMALQNNINISPPSFPTLSNDDWAMLVQKGEKGEQGTGVRILGTLVNESELPSIGEPGDAYLINGDLYVWSDTTDDWTNVGTIKGPKGDQGIQGPKGDKGDKGDPGEDADVEAINQQIGTLRTEVTEQLEQLEQTTENHMNNQQIHVTQAKQTAWQSVYDRFREKAIHVTDLNAVFNSGIYFINETGLNTPYNSYWLVFVQAHQDVFLIQTTRNVSDGNEYERQCINGVWNEWAEITPRKLFQSVSNGKAQVASAITGKGVQTASDATFSQMTNNINAIQTQISVKGEIPLSPIPSNGLLEVYTPWFDFQPMYFSSTLPGMSLYNGFATPQISTATNAFYILNMDTYNQVVNEVLQWRLKLLIKNAYSFTSTQNKMDYFISK